MQAKSEMTKGTIELGDTPIVYESAAMQHYPAMDHRKKSVEPIYQNKNQSLHVWTGAQQNANAK